MTIPAKYEYGILPASRPAKLASIRELEFAGMWADRHDIPDWVSYVNELRDHPRG